jgi:hypothetical protein
MDDETGSSHIPTQEEPQEIQGADPESGSVSDGTEPWLPIETKLVVATLVTGMVALIVLATLVHLFLLGGGR